LRAVLLNDLFEADVLDLFHSFVIQVGDFFIEADQLHRTNFDSLGQA
jgi:hypothetical protein